MPKGQGCHQGQTQKRQQEPVFISGQSPSPFQVNPFTAMMSRKGGGYTPAKFKGPSGVTGKIPAGGADKVCRQSPVDGEPFPGRCRPVLRCSPPANDPFPAPEP